MNRSRIIKWLIICSTLKLGQEWVLHGGRYLDSFTFFEAVTAIWDFVSFWS
jgi:hypothetical protein